MKCPHCLKEFHEEVGVVAPGGGRYDGDIKEGRTSWRLLATRCPACKKVTLILHELEEVLPGKLTIRWTRMVRPKMEARVPLSSLVPSKASEDYLEACAVLPDSPKASAALTRRCLQHVLREAGGFDRKDLFDQIQQAMDSNTLPSDIVKNLDAVRVIGNFAAHSMKSTNSGEILDVEPGEAEWNLEVVEQLFDFYFVRPAENQKRIDALNAKLKEAGKPPLRQ